jgi:Family of unknown function (DUF5681)
MARGGKPKERLRAERKKPRSTASSGSSTGTGRRGRIENLRPWKPGQSGNPKGRALKRPISQLYALFSDLKISELPERIRKRFIQFTGRDDLSLSERGAMGVYEAMAKGNPTAAKELREAIEGKSAQRAEVEIVAGPRKGQMSTADLLVALRVVYGMAPLGDTDAGARNELPLESSPIAP